MLKDDEIILISEEEFETQLEAILEVRKRKLCKVLVQWKGYSPKEASWKDFNVVSTHFPTFFVEDSSIS